MRATTTASARATITLAIHPRFGEEFVVRWSYGTGSVRLETAQGRQLIVPLEWTDLRPRVLQTLHAGRTVHLEPVALQELARWVEARAAARDTRNLATLINASKVFVPMASNADRRRERQASGNAETRGVHSPRVAAHREVARPPLRHPLAMLLRHSRRLTAPSDRLPGPATHGPGRRVPAPHHARPSRRLVLALRPDSALPPTSGAADRSIWTSCVIHAPVTNRWFDEHDRLRVEVVVGELAVRDPGFGGERVPVPPRTLLSRGPRRGTRAAMAKRSSVERRGRGQGAERLSGGGGGDVRSLVALGFAVAAPGRCFSLPEGVDAWPERELSATRRPWPHFRTRLPSVSTVCGIPFSAANIDPYGISKPRLVRAAEFVTLFYRNYFRVTCSGIEHVPTEGRCMLVGNHSGGFALDAGMLAAACFWELSPPRLAHAMVDRFVYRLPFLSTWMSRLGQFASIGDSVAERAGIGAVRGYVRHQVSVRMLLLLVRCA